MKTMITTMALMFCITAFSQKKDSTSKQQQPADTTIAIVMTAEEYRGFKAFIDNTSNAPNLELKRMLAWVESRKKVLPPQKGN